MSKRNHRCFGIANRDRRLRCPVCHQRTGFSADRHRVGDRMDFLSLRPADLTQCDHCLTVLEYRGEPTSLTLHQAPRKRVEAFNRLSQEGYREPKLSELVDYVRKYRQMPKQPSDLFRRQRSKLIAMGNER